MTKNNSTANIEPLKHSFLLSALIIYYLSKGCQSWTRFYKNRYFILCYISSYVYYRGCKSEYYKEIIVIIQESFLRIDGLPWYPFQANHSTNISQSEVIFYNDLWYISNFSQWYLSPKHFEGESTRVKHVGSERAFSKKRWYEKLLWISIYNPAASKAEHKLS